MATKRRRPRSPLKPGEKVLPGVRANEGIAARYRAALDKLITQMNESVLFWIRAAFREDPPIATELAMDAGGMSPRPFKMTPGMLGRLLDLAEGLPALAKASRTRDRLLREGLVQRKAGTDDYVLTPAGQKAIEDRARAERTTLRGLRRAADPFITVSEPGELPSSILTEAVAKLTARWNRQFDRAAPLLADYFSKATEERSSAQLQKILREGGFSVRFQPTQAMLDVLNATTSANVALIKSIPQQYLTQVEGMVMRSVQAGGDLATLSRNIEHQFGVTKRRAAFIARDQNQKATAAMIKARQNELSLFEAIWRHSHGGRDKRPTHVANDGKRYNTLTGWYDAAVKQYIQPGELPNCKCFSQTIIPGFFVAEAA